MNLQLLDPFQVQNDYPEAIKDTLDPGCATCVAFNRKGTLLAVGTKDGRVVVYDFDTRGLAQVMIGHIRPVTSVSWSRSGRLLLTSSLDWNVVLWDVVRAKQLHKRCFDSPVLSAQLHPRQEALALVCPYMSSAEVCDMQSGKRSALAVDDSASDAGSDNDESAPSPSVASSSGTGRASEQQAVAAWCKANGRIFLYTGVDKTMIHILDPDTLQPVQALTVPGAHAVKAIRFSRDGKLLLVNSTDRVLRLYDALSVELQREFVDVVNRMQWKQGCFSPDGDYVIAGSAQSQEHKIYIWIRSYGSLIHTLEGPKEGVIDVLWHPSRPIIVSVATSGQIFVWERKPRQNWSAFAPDFQELEDNVEYQEREDEFDIVDEDAAKDGAGRKQDDDEIIDIETVEHVTEMSSDEEEGDLLYLPSRPMVLDAPLAPTPAAAAAFSSAPSASASIAGVARAAAPPPRPVLGVKRSAYQAGLDADEAAAAAADNAS